VTRVKARGVGNDDATTIDLTDSDDKSDGGVFPAGVSQGIKTEDVEIEDVPEGDEGDIVSVNPPESLGRGKESENSLKCTPLLTGDGGMIRSGSHRSKVRRLPAKRTELGTSSQERDTIQREV